MRAPIRQRLRITFAKGEQIKYISHLDLFRTWKRALRRAQVPLAYSQGFNPRAKIAIASALPVGFTSEGELMDIILERRVAPRHFAQRVAAQLPAGLSIKAVEEIYPSLPSLQSQLRLAEYSVTVESDEPVSSLNKRLQRLLSADSLPRQRRTRRGVKEYDLRPLIDALWIEGKRNGHYLLGMRLRSGDWGTGRPDEVVDALGLGDRLRGVCRNRLLLAFDR
ncbi:MAG: TIGR03936 family radical SAM-associated protein [Anaerolineae bacterium]